MANTDSGQIDEQLWEVKEILDEKKRTYKVAWAGKDENGNPWPVEWIPKANANEALVESWEEAKGLEKIENAKNPKAGSRLRKTASTASVCAAAKSTPATGEPTSVTSSRTPASTRSSARLTSAQPSATLVVAQDSLTTKKRRASQAFPDPVNSSSEESDQEEQLPAPSKKPKMKFVRGPASVQAKAQRLNDSSLRSKSATKSTTSRVATSSKKASSESIPKSVHSNSSNPRSTEPHGSRKSKSKPRSKQPTVAHDSEEEQDEPPSPVARSTRQTPLPDRHDDGLEFDHLRPPSAHDFDDFFENTNQRTPSPVGPKSKPNARSGGSSQRIPNSNSRSNPADDSTSSYKGTVISDSQSQSKRIHTLSSPETQAAPITTKVIPAELHEPSDSEKGMPPPAFSPPSKPRSPSPNDSGDEETNPVDSQIVGEHSFESVAVDDANGDNSPSPPATRKKQMRRISQMPIPSLATSTAPEVPDSQISEWPDDEKEERVVQKKQAGQRPTQNGKSRGAMNPQNRKSGGTTVTFDVPESQQSSKTEGDQSPELTSPVSQRIQVGPLPHGKDNSQPTFDSQVLADADELVDDVFDNQADLHLGMDDMDFGQFSQPFSPLRDRVGFDTDAAAPSSPLVNPPSTSSPKKRRTELNASPNVPGLTKSLDAGLAAALLALEQKDVQLRTREEECETLRRKISLQKEELCSTKDELEELAALYQESTESHDKLIAVTSEYFPPGASQFLTQAHEPLATTINLDTSTQTSPEPTRALPDSTITKVEEQRAELEALRKENTALLEQQKTQDEKNDYFLGLYKNASEAASDLGNENRELQKAKATLEGQVELGLKQVEMVWSVQVKTLEAELEKSQAVLKLVLERERRIDSVEKARALDWPGLVAKVDEMQLGLDRFTRENREVVEQGRRRGWEEALDGQSTRTMLKKARRRSEQEVELIAGASEDKSGSDRELEEGSSLEEVRDQLHLRGMEEIWICRWSEGGNRCEEDFSSRQGLERHILACGHGLT